MKTIALLFTLWILILSPKALATVHPIMIDSLPHKGKDICCNIGDTLKFEALKSKWKQEYGITIYGNNVTKLDYYFAGSDTLYWEYVVSGLEDNYELWYVTQSNYSGGMISFQNIVAGFSGSNVCYGATTNFTDNSFTNGTLTSWDWDFGELASGSNNYSTLQNPSHIYSTPGLYTVTIIVGNNSGDKDTIAHTVEVYPLPYADFASPTTTICAGTSVCFSDASQIISGNIGGWNWNFGDPNSATNLSTLQNPCHIYPNGGIYTVMLTVFADHGCYNTDFYTLLVNVCTGIQTTPQTKLVTISPNPFSKQTILQTDNIVKDATLTLYNSSGQQVKQMNNISGQTITLNRDDLPIGIYFIQLKQDNDTIITSKLMITDN